MIRFFAASGFAGYVVTTVQWGWLFAFLALSWLIMIDVIGASGLTWAHLKSEI